MSLCGAKKKDSRGGGTCDLAAGWGTDHVGFGTCRFHGGMTPNAEKHAAKLEAMSLAAALAADGEPRDHVELMLRRVQVQAGMVDWAVAQVAQLHDTEAYGPTGGNEYGTKYEPHVLLRIRGEEEDRLMKFIKACHDMNIDERRVAFQEQTGERMAAALRFLLGEFGLLGDPRAPGIVKTALLQMTGGTEEKT